MFLLHRESVVIIIHENWIISKLDYAIFQSPLLLEFLELIAQRNECTFLLALGFTKPNQIVSFFNTGNHQNALQNSVMSVLSF
jgi:hypothetical protein